MNLLEKPTPSLTIGIGEFGLDISSDDRELLDRLAVRYSGFLSQNPVSFRVRVARLAGEPGGRLEPEVEFEGRMLRLGGQNHRGTIDGAGGAAEYAFATAHPVESVDYVLRLATAVIAFQLGGLLLHGAAVVRHGTARVFFGPSGSGKTTVTRLSAQDQALNDDLVMLLPIPSGWRALGTPFSNPTQVRPANRQAPLGGMFRLVQDRRVFLEQQSEGQAAADLLACVPVLPASPDYALDLLERCERLQQDVPVRRLHFLPDLSFWNPVDELIERGNDRLHGLD